MKHVFGLAIAITIGALALHCSSGHPGGVGDATAADSPAGGGTCCTVTAPTFTTLMEGDVAVSASNALEVAFPGPAVDVSAYREVVFGISVTGCNLRVTTAFKEPSSAVFVNTGSSGTGRIRVDGPTAQSTFFASGPGSPCTGNVHYVYAGVGLN
jgi:hypothetical protein